MVMLRNWKWWSPVGTMARLGWSGIAPLSSLADIGEPRIGITSDAYRQPVILEACGISPRTLAILSRTAPNNAAFSQMFAVYQLDEASQTDPTPVSGHYIIDYSRLTLILHQPLTEGKTYRAVLQLNDAAWVNLRPSHSQSRATSWCQCAVPLRFLSKPVNVPNSIDALQSL